MQRIGRAAVPLSIASLGLLPVPELSDKDGLNAAWNLVAAPADLSETARKPCPRCGGRMLMTGTEGDLSCFSCGHHIYSVAPELDLQIRNRGPSSGGYRLD
jgi:ribosomal protein S27AE